MIYPRRHKQLFLDDDAIETKYGLRRTLSKPDRVGPVMRPDQSRGQVTLQSSSVPQWNSEQGVWEWWYRAGYPLPPSGTRPDARVEPMHYATSTDGLHWDTPSLGLYEWNGSKDNNLAVDPDGMKLYHVLRDERDEDPERRYKALFARGGSDRYPAVSPDGFDWTMIDVPPVPSGDTSHLTFDEITEQFVATVKITTEWGRSVWLSTSEDFIEWTEPEVILHSDEIDRNNRRRRVRQVVEDPAYLSPPVVANEDYIAQVYRMSIMPYEGLYIGFPVLFNPAGPWRGANFFGISQVELAVSGDLRDWKRVANRDVFIGVQPWDGERYDTAQLLTCGRPVVREDLGEIWVYYDACRFRAAKEDVDESYHKYWEDLNAVALAKVRLDGFVSLDALNKGTMVTAPFVLDGGELRTNVDATQGELRVAVLDAGTMEPLPGLSVADCDMYHGDELRARLTWNGSGPSARGRPVRLRFEMSQAKLYAFWLEG